ncbi:hypothetical protein SFC66_11550 [Terribacillus saccharophilus]|uniref:hypothetical protein n=1 Tax=Terribacillus saccharophilus TaxID=361277 RepID=UPI003982191D
MSTKSFNKGAGISALLLGSGGLLWGSFATMPVILIIGLVLMIVAVIYLSRAAKYRNEHNDL